MDAPPTRKPYRITKQREKWTDAEHQRFLDAVDKFGRSWKEIVDHVGTRSVAQVRSHAQKYFLKLEKSGKASVVPPPRPKKRAAKPYPVQDRSEDTKRREARSDDARRKSRRVQRQASPAASDDASAPSTSQPANTGCAITSASPSARSSMRSAGTAAAAPGGSAGGSVALRPVRTTRSARAGLASPKGSSADLLEGHASYNASVHGSNTERSEPSGEHQEPSGLSSSDLNYSGDGELPTTTQVVVQQQEAGRASASDLPRADYGKLYNVVEDMFGGPMNDETAHKQMIQQLEPTQREALLAMMSQLTGNLRSSVDQTPLDTGFVQQLAQQQQLAQGGPEAPLADCQPLDAGSRRAMSSISAPRTPPAGSPHHAHQQQPVQAHPLNQLDYAASMPLMPESASLPMPQPADEALASLRPLPGSQGTALLRSGFAAPAAQLAPPPPLATAESCCMGPADASMAPALLASASQCATDGAPAPATMEVSPSAALDEQLFGAMRAGSDLDATLLLGKEPSMLSTPLDDCLAQLETGHAPSALVSESEDFLEAWKIGSSDPVWQTLM